MDVLFELLVNGNEAVELDEAALAVAAIERPALPAKESLERLEEWAGKFRDRAGAGASGEDFLSAYHAYFFQELGFDGNRQDYYDPRNSCLDWVMERRSGIPITLSVVYMELARRVGRTVYGIGLPGHFVVEYVEPDYRTYVDVFHSRIRTPEECLATSALVTGQAAPVGALARTDRRAIVLRMLRNLQGIYLKQRNWAKGLQVLDWLVAAEPESPGGYAARAECLYRMGRIGPAVRDLETLLRIVPGKQDAAQFSERLAQLRRQLARYN